MWIYNEKAIWWSFPKQTSWRANKATRVHSYWHARKTCELVSTSRYRYSLYVCWWLFLIEVGVVLFLFSRKEKSRKKEAFGLNVLVYFDDLIFNGNNENMIQEFNKHMMQSELHIWKLHLILFYYLKKLLYQLYHTILQYIEHPKTLFFSHFI